MAKSKTERDFDVVIWGATGFVGRLTVEYMAKAHSDARWAIAGRNRSKLERLRDEVAAEFPSVSNVPILEADADDSKSLEDLVAKTRVIATTVGPYGLYGKPLVQACINQGTDYCDLTGEVPFIRWTIDEFHQAAKASSTRIVSACGFDSIPSDMGVFFLAEHARSQGKRLAEVHGFVTDTKGGVSGGTVASMMLISDMVRRDRAVARQLVDPYSLSPGEAGPDKPDRFSPRYDGDLRGWTAPWIMGGVNTRVVRRSNALMDHAYGRSFSYTEELLMRGGPLGLFGATATAAGLLGGLALIAMPLTRKLVAKRLPAPGEGPSKRARERGHFTLRFFGRFEGDSRVSAIARVSGRGDPGYLATSRMFAESALCLAQDPPRPGFEGGVLTPAVAMGTQLVERLGRAEMTFEIESAR